MDAVDIRPDAAVQGLVGSPGWIVFGDNGGGDRLAVDLTPGPRGHIGQVVVLSHDSAQPWLYLYSDLDGNPWRFLDSSGRPSVEVSYDPLDPGKAVRADGAGRWIPGILPLSSGIVGVLLLIAFLATPFMDFGPTCEEYRNQYR